MDPRSDEDLMAAHVAGEAGAFEALVARHAGRVRALARRALQRPEDVEDLVQETFLQLHRARHDFRPGAPLRPWLTTIALNLVRGHLRREQRHPERTGDVPEVPVAPQALERLETARRQAALRGALARLPATWREVVELHWVLGLGYPEVARRLGSTPGAVRVRAHRAYQRLRGLLTEGPGGGPDR